MTDHDDIQHRAYHQSDPDRVEVRESLEDSDGMFSVRMPIASTGEVRNEGDDPLTRSELEGMAEQIDSRSVGVFLDHGQNMAISGSRYSATGQVGEWANAELAEADDTTLLEADARLMDPETLPSATGAVREALAALKAQIERGLSLSSSIGWREDDAYPGGNDLMEASIVGIGADPRTTSDAPTAIAARALTADDRDAFERRLEDLRAVVMGPDNSTQATDMTDEATESGDDPDNTNESDDVPDAEEFRSRMIEMQQTQTETLNTLADALREDSEDDDEGDDDEEGDEDEQAADEPGEERTIDVDGEELGADDIREMREQLADADPDVEDDDTDNTQDEQPDSTTSDPLQKYDL